MTRTLFTLAAALLMFAMSGSAGLAQQPPTNGGFAYVNFSSAVRENDVFIFGGALVGQPASKVRLTGNFRITPSTGSVAPLSPEFIFGTGSSAAILDDTIYVAGGSGLSYRVVSKTLFAAGNSSAFAAYNATRDTWERLPDLPVKIHGHCSFATREFVYVLGGETEFKRGLTNKYGALETVLRYSIADRVWTQLSAPAEAQTTSAACTVLGDEFFMIGGATNEPTKQAWAWNYKANTWRRIPDLPHPSFSGSATALGNALLFAGGITYEAPADPRTIDRHIWELSPGAQTWRAIGEVEAGRTGHVLAATEGQAWLVGGDTERSLRPPSYSSSLRGWWLERVK
jgi:N-acetylneuraminic acid mutarotase